MICVCKLTTCTTVLTIIKPSRHSSEINLKFTLLKIIACLMYRTTIFEPCMHVNTVFHLYKK